jgi:hypothetical protein
MLAIVLSIGCASHAPQPKLPAPSDATLPPLSVREVTYSHEDRVGGIRVALQHGIAVHALVLTAQRSVASAYSPPTDTFDNQLSLEVDGVHPTGATSPR